MSTVRECQRGINLKRTARLLQARRERALHQQRGHDRIFARAERNRVWEDKFMHGTEQENRP